MVESTNMKISFQSNRLNIKQIGENNIFKTIKKILQKS